MYGYSPEEKLLLLIRRNKKKTAAPVSSVKSASAARRFELSYFFKKFKISSKALTPGLLSAINKALGALTALMAGYFIFMLLAPHAAGRVPLPYGENAIVSGQGNDAASAQSPRPYSLYETVISSKKLFGPSLGQPSGQKEGYDAHIAGRFFLVGIIGGDDMQAIVEDKENQKTYYLRQGQSLQNFLIEEIKEDAVILDYRGTKVRLTL